MRIPNGCYCWNHVIGKICIYLNNSRDGVSGKVSCKLNFTGQNRNACGIVKPKECKLWERKNTVGQ